MPASANGRGLAWGLEIMRLSIHRALEVGAMFDAIQSVFRVPIAQPAEGSGRLGPFRVRKQVSKGCKGRCIGQLTAHFLQQVRGGDQIGLLILGRLQSKL